MSDAKTWSDLVRSIWTNTTDEQVELLLWETTCFPMGSPLEVRDQLQDLHTKSHGNFDKALEISYAELTDAMEKAKFWEALTDDYTN